MHVTCRARDFRAYLALDVQQENREKMKFLTCCVLQAERGVAKERDIEREREMRFIVYMFYVISNLCLNSNRRRAKPPQNCIHSCLKWQHPLDVATVGNSYTARLEYTPQQNVTQNMSEGLRCSCL